MVDDNILRAAEAVSSARILVISAGAGMGVDSGLPDFRGHDGFWRAYPPLAKLGMAFERIASPATFARDPYLAWGFYGHRLNLYRKTVPHDGFALLHRWQQVTPGGGFVMTSNVDGQFQRAGFAPERIVELHGSIHRLQCQNEICGPAWSAADLSIAVDETTLLAREPLPTCPQCGRIARPNLLMFYDSDWISDDYDNASQQLLTLDRSLSQNSGVVIVEIGAGNALPTLREIGEAWQRRGATLIRINPREVGAPAGGIVLPMGALDALTAIDRAIFGR